MSMNTMLSVLLLCMLVATPMAVEYDAGSDNSGPWTCSGVPTTGTVPACQTLVKLQCVGAPVPQAVLRDCCQQVAEFDDWCRCRAISTMKIDMYRQLGVQEGQAAWEVFRGCRRNVMEVTVASVPAVCRLPIIIDASGQHAYVCT
uniref:Uncharacterized protein n=1 Tax=Avena sativa TaxID=4498 RepID=A0ACD5X0B3_AVESA